MRAKVEICKFKNKKRKINNEKQTLKSQYSKNCKRRNTVIYSSVITKNSGCWNHTIQDLITAKKQFKKKKKKS